MWGRGFLLRVLRVLAVFDVTNGSVHGQELRYRLADEARHRLAGRSGASSESLPHLWFDHHRKFGH